jgi:hypothetical protein
MKRFTTPAQVNVVEKIAVLAAKLWRIELWGSDE